jgi:hypothetical protein
MLVYAMLKVSDAKKEIEIEISGKSQNNCVTRAVFTMRICRPFQAEATFDASDIKTLQGKTGVNFSCYSAVAKALKSGKKDVLITLPDDTIQSIRDESEKYITTLKAEAAARVPAVWYWSISGELYQLSIYPDTGLEFRDDLREMMELLEKNQMKILKDLKEKSREAPKGKMNESYGPWFEIDHEIILGMAGAISQKIQERRDAAQNEKTQREEAAFKIAKETGERAIIRKWTVPCEDREEECSTDVVVEYAMPDGTKKTEQYHTW